MFVARRAAGPGSLYGAIASPKGCPVISLIGHHFGHILIFRSFNPEWPQNDQVKTGKMYSIWSQAIIRASHGVTGKSEYCQIAHSKTFPNASFDIASFPLFFKKMIFFHQKKNGPPPKTTQNDRFGHNNKPQHGTGVSAAKTASRRTPGLHLV